MSRHFNKVIIQLPNEVSSYTGVTAKIRSSIDTDRLVKVLDDKVVTKVFGYLIAIAKRNLFFVTLLKHCC